MASLRFLFRCFESGLWHRTLQRRGYRNINNGFDLVLTAANPKDQRPSSRNTHPNQDLVVMKIQVGAIRGLFGEAAQGDLVVISSRLQERDILIGEFLDGPATRVTSSRIETFLGVPTPVRRVRWFDSVNELRLPTEISEVLRIPVPFSLLSRNLSEPIFQTTFRTYYRPTEYVAGIKIGSEDFTAQDNLDLALLVKYSAVLLSSLDSDDISEQIKGYVDAFVASEFQPSLSLNINSSGFGFFRAATIVPLAFAAFLALASVVDTGEMPAANDVTVINGLGEKDDVCAAAVDAAVKLSFEMMGYTQWKAMCLRSKRLNATAKLSVDSKAKIQR